MATLVGLITLAAGSYGAFLYLRPAPLPEGLIYGNGHVEGTEVRVGAEIAGRVVESRLVEGQPVAAGDLLIRLDDQDLRIRLAQAEAEEAALQQETARIEKELEIWRHHLRTAETDLARYAELRERGTIAQQRLDEAEDVFQEARGRVAALEARLAETAARLDATRQGVRLVQSQLDKTEIRAPIDATVLVKAVETGEVVAPGQTVAVLVDLSRLELRVFIPERDIGKVKLGDPARVGVDAFPERYFAGRVSRVDQQAQFTPRDIHMPDERIRMVFGVTLALDNPERLLKPGMPVDAWILWQTDGEWPPRLIVPQ